MVDLSRFFRFAALALALAISCAAQAQSSCSSDGRSRPVALVERFINADCETCWAGKLPRQARLPRGELAVDWIVPGARGDDAPLSAAATRDALARLEAIQRPVPAQADTARHPLVGGAGSLRVAHGLAFNGYLGASIELRPRAAGPWHAWLLLVEAVPAGTDGTSVARNLVRNALQVNWDVPLTLSKKERMRLFESRPMSIPEGANPKRLRVVGWVEDARARVITAAQSACVAG